MTTCLASGIAAGLMNATTSAPAPLCFISRKRSLDPVPALVGQRACVGKKGKGLKSFFQPDPGHHHRVIRPRGSCVQYKNAAAAAADDAHDAAAGIVAGLDDAMDIPPETTGAAN
eukprot:COSAG01_NODE_26087_length_723_cov_23.434295_1_plen_114_part_10